MDMWSDSRNPESHRPAETAKPWPLWLTLVAVIGAPTAAAVLALVTLAATGRPGSPPKKPSPEEPVKIVPMDDPSPGRAVNGLQAQLAAPQTAFKLGEDVRLTLNIRNVSQAKISLLAHQDKLSRYALHTRFVMLMPDGRSSIIRDRSGYAWTEPSLPSRIVLGPGEVYTWSMVLNNWWAPWCTIGKLGLPPGTYRIYAEYSLTPRTAGPPLWSGTLRSNAVTFEVTHEAAPHDPEKIFWGKPAQGLRYGVTIDKAIYEPGEKPAGTLIVENLGTAETPDGRILVADFAKIWCGDRAVYIALSDRPDAIMNPKGMRLAKGERFERRFDLAKLLSSYRVKGPVTLRSSVQVVTTNDLTTPGPWTKGCSSGEVRILIARTRPTPAPPP